MRYDKYVTKETYLNCKFQGFEDWLIESYVERVLHELKILNSGLRRKT